MDRVNENIDQELRLGERQKAELRKAVRAAGVEAATADEQREMEVDLHLFGQRKTVNADDYHSVDSLLAAVETACANVEREIADIDREAADLLKELNTTVGDLSDLRYGKLQGPAGTENTLGSETIQALQTLEEACYKGMDTDVA